MNPKSLSIAKQITSDLINIIETTGHLPWEKEWQGGLSIHGGLAPRNYDRHLSGKPSAYNGINIWSLMGRADREGWDSPWFMTFNQAKARGGSVIKGSKGTTITYWNITMYDANNNVTKDPKEAVKKVPFLAKSSVFNAAQIEGIDFPEIKRPQPKTDNELIEAAEAIKDGYEGCPDIKYGGGSAFYRPKTDTVHMPSIESFNNSFSFYKTEFHELIHSTGHQSRLARKGITEFDKFGSTKYSKEELIAELGAAFLASVSGCYDSKQEKNSAAYLKGWIKSLKDDPAMILAAAGAAQKAAEHILGCPLDEYQPLPEELEVEAAV